MKTAQLQVLTTAAFRDWLRREAREAGVSVAELVRIRSQLLASLFLSEIGNSSAFPSVSFPANQTKHPSSIDA
jgi:hypothetical protein